MGFASKIFIFAVIATEFFINLACRMSCAQSQAQCPAAAPAPAYDEKELALKLVPWLIDHVDSIPNAVDRLVYGQSLALSFPAYQKKIYNSIADSIDNTRLATLLAANGRETQVNLGAFLQSYDKIDPDHAAQLRRSLSSKAVHEAGGSIFAQQFSQNNPDYMHELQNGLQSFARSPGSDLSAVRNLLDNVGTINDYIVLDPNQPKVDPEQYLALLKKKQSSPDDSNSEDDNSLHDMEINLRRQGFRPDPTNNSCPAPTQETMPQIDLNTVKDSLRAAVNQVSQLPVDSLDGWKLAERITSLSRDQGGLLSDDELKAMNRSERLAAIRSHLWSGDSEMAKDLFGQWGSRDDDDESEKKEPPKLTAAKAKLSQEIANCKDDESEAKILDELKQIPTDEQLGFYEQLMLKGPSPEKTFSLSLAFYQENISQSERDESSRFEADAQMESIYGTYLGLPCMTFERGLQAGLQAKNGTLQTNLIYRLITHTLAASKPEQ